MPNPAKQLTRRERVLAILEANERLLLRYALRLVRDEHTARDVVQHAFLRLCEQSLETLENVRPWLYAVCRNKAMDTLRANGKTSSMESGTAETLLGRELDPAKDIERRDLHHRVWDLVQRFSAEQQELLQLWTNGLKFKEIAEITARTEVGVRVAIHRLLNQLRHDVAVQAILPNDPLSAQETSHER